MFIQKSEIELRIKDRSAMAYLAVPEKGGPGVLVLHAWWGLIPFIKQVCDRLAEQGFTALAPDLYQGRTAKTIHEAKALVGKRDHQIMDEAVMAAKDYLLGVANGETIGVLGFSMGAFWSLYAAANAPEQVSAVVLFYGSRNVDFSQLRANILGHYAEKDEWEPLEGVREWEKDMKAAGLNVTFYVYPKTSHWFVEEDRPEYHPAASLLAWNRTFNFLKKNL